MIYNIIYVIVWCCFAALYYMIFRCIKLERLFTQGRVFEIRLFYVLLTFVLSFLTTEGVFKLASLVIPFNN